MRSNTNILIGTFVLLSFFSVLTNATSIIPRALIADDYPNTQETAKGIPLNSLIVGSNESSGDEDWFKFSVTSVDGFNFSMSTKNRDSDYPYFVLYNKTGAELHEEMFSTTEETVSLNLEAGTYYIKLYQYNGNTTEYQFFIETEQENTEDFLLDNVTIEYCKNSPSSCGISITSLGGYTQEELSEAKEEGKQECVTNPITCNITMNGSTTPPVGLSPALRFHLNELIYTTPEGQKKLWADFKYVPNEAKLLFEVTEFGEVIDKDQDNDGFSIEEGDCHDTDFGINPNAEEILNDGVDQDCINSSDD